MRVFHWFSGFAVALWLIAVFVEVGEASRLAAVPENPERRARVRPVAAVEPAEAPAPPPENSRELERAPEEDLGQGEGSISQVVVSADFADGERLLDAAGDFPVLSLSYEAFPSFGAYARAMRRLGARFVVVRSRDIVGELDLESGAIAVPNLGASFSPRARDYSDEPELARTASMLRKRFGRRAVVMMLVPRSLDAGLFGGVARVLEQRGEVRGDLREIHGRYERGASGGVQLRLDGALRSDGSRFAMDAVFDLTQIQQASRG